MDHPYFADIREKEFEIVCESKFDCRYEEKAKDIDDYRKLIYAEMRSFHPSFDPNDVSTYKAPILKDDQLPTLTYTGDRKLIKSTSFMTKQANEINFKEEEEPTVTK